MSIDLQAVRNGVKSALPERRWQHTQGVIAESIRLAERYGADVNKAELAATLHDYVKYWPTSRMEQVIRDESLPPELLQYDKELWHAPVGAVMAEKDFSVRDLEILDAIRYHTSGRPGMTLMDKVVCLADYIEPARDFPGVDRIRELADRSLEQALLAGFDSTLTFLISKSRRIFPLTVLARNALIEEVQNDL